MWNKGKYIGGLFVAINEGNIVECHGTVSENLVKGKKKQYIYPFCGQNTGTIEYINESHLEDNSKSAEEEVVSTDQSIESSVIAIRSASQLLEISKQISTGDPFYCNGNYKLLQDLDLQNRKWLPIGISESIPFGGTFDGNGHSIKNLSVKGNKKEYVGFFGYLKKANICNLSIEGKMKGGKYAGAIAGVSEDSIITSCFASVEICGSSCAGGFIGKNTGKILHCYYSGAVKHK